MASTFFHRDFFLPCFLNFHYASSSIVTSQMSNEGIELPHPSDVWLPRVWCLKNWHAGVTKRKCLFNQCSASLQYAEHFPGTLQTLGYLLHTCSRKENEFTKTVRTKCVKSKRDILSTLFAQTVEHAEGKKNMPVTWRKRSAIVKVRKDFDTAYCTW